MRKSRFNVLGMTCSSCSSHVERAVRKLVGVKKCDVNLLLKNMIVEYDDTNLSTDDIIDAVISAGYSASLIDNKARKKENILDNKNDIKNMKIRLIISICFLIPLMYISMHHMLYGWLDILVPKIIKNIFDGYENLIIFSFSQFILLLPIIYLNRNYFITGFKMLFKRTPNMDSLIAIGSFAATIYGIFSIFIIGYGLGHQNLELVESYSQNIYFESAGTILTLITLGKYLEAKSKNKTTDAISKLINLAPKKSIIIRDEKEIEVDTENIIIDDIVVIKPGSSVPVDGIVIYGDSYIDQSSITGESIPIRKNIGDKVISGTLNKNGYLKIRATKVGDNTTLSQIVKLVKEASSSKAPISKLADKVSYIFVPCVITLALLSCIFWLLNGQSFEFALNTGISVLVISCPCALGLATPVAIMVGTGIGAKNGILVKSAESLEILHLIDTVLIDKTGTITNGKLEVTDIISFIDEIELLKIAGTLEKRSEHPIAEAILQKVESNNIEIYKLKNFASNPGLGIKGKINDKFYFAGNINFMKENNITLSDIENKSKKFLEQGKTIVYFADKSNIIGIIAIADTVKETSKKAIKELKKKNIDVMMITGDNELVAKHIGNKVGIQNIISEVLPQDKEGEVKKLQQSGKKVAFVGDGINDSPALTKADVGIAIGAGTDIAIESADIILMKNDLLDIVTAINLSRNVISNIKMNLFWAFFYNIIGIPIAAGMLYLPFGIKLSPMLGALAMSLSSVCVVVNVLRINKFKSNYREEYKVNKKEKIVYINGMQCNHCKMSVEKALNQIDGIINVQVSLDDKKAIIECEDYVTNDSIKKSIEEEGFTVYDIK